MTNNNNNLFEEVNTKFFDNMNDNISMKTKVWGPPAWFFLHSIAMAYPKKINNNNPEHIRIKNSMFTFLSHLGNILPCAICGVSYSRYIREPELSIEKYLDSRAKLSYFMWLIHEKVNDKLGVPHCDRFNLEETTKYFYKFRAQGKIPCSATTDQERINSLLTGCDEKDIKNKHFKDYKCYVNIVDENEKNGKNEKNEKNGKEYFGNTNNYNSLNKSLLILCILSIIIIFALLLFIFKNKKKIFR